MCCENKNGCCCKCNRPDAFTIVGTACLALIALFLGASWYFNTFYKVEVTKSNSADNGNRVVTIIQLEEVPRRWWSYPDVIVFDGDNYLFESKDKGWRKQFGSKMIVPKKEGIVEVDGCEYSIERGIHTPYQLVTTSADCRHFGPDPRAIFVYKGENMIWSAQRQAWIGQYCSSYVAEGVDKDTVKIDGKLHKLGGKVGPYQKFVPKCCKCCCDCCGD